jgi:hypothetical protein
MHIWDGISNDFSWVFSPPSVFWGDRGGRGVVAEMHFWRKELEVVEGKSLTLSTSLRPLGLHFKIREMTRWPISPSLIWGTCLR